MTTFDAVFVGSGINSLVGAALLAREGWSVCVLERNDVAGGCIRTSTDLTLPGFTHEVLASWHPLFTGSAAYAELGRTDDALDAVEQGKRKNPHFDLASFGSRFQDPALQRRVEDSLRKAGLN